jgi:ribosome modulation factor
MDFGYTPFFGQTSNHFSSHSPDPEHQVAKERSWLRRLWMLPWSFSREAPIGPMLGCWAISRQVQPMCDASCFWYSFWCCATIHLLEWCGCFICIVATLLSKVSPFVCSIDVRQQEHDRRFRAHEEARSYSAGLAGMSAFNCPSPFAAGKSPSSDSG